MGITVKEDGGVGLDYMAYAMRWKSAAVRVRGLHPVGGQHLYNYPV